MRSTDEVRRLESYQTLIGLGILFMVCSVSTYGGYVGRLLSSKHRELDEACEGLRRSEARAISAAAELQAVNESVVGLNCELSDNMKRLKEAQDTIIRKAKLAQLGQLTATVAHEIRNPLGIVRAAAYLIERRLEDANPDIAVQVNRINDGVARCDAIITELLDFTRTRNLETEPVALDEWLSKVVVEQAAELPAMIELQCRYRLPGDRIAFDQVHLQRVIINLLSNAAEAMVGKGDDPASFHTARPRIVIETLRTDRGVEIWCTDNGPGISTENLHRIREPLFTTKSYGVGLGLPAVERILDQHGGGLDIDTAVGRGTTMKVWLPDRAEQKRVA
jgi:signal transduction histidine kinase